MTLWEVTFFNRYNINPFYVIAEDIQAAALLAVKKAPHGPIKMSWIRSITSKYDEVVV